MPDKVVINSLASLAKDFYSKEGVTFDSLLKDSGYADLKTPLSLDDLILALNNNELMDAWISWSENKRTNGWYIKLESNSFRVGFIDSEGTEMQHYNYSSKSEACARFLIRELGLHVRE